MVAAPAAGGLSRQHSRTLLVAFAWFAVAALGLLEAAYGRTNYGNDWVAYLNVSRAVAALDWRSIFDPMWNPLYPALVALARLAAPPTAEGEWHAITVLNWLILLGAFAAWRWLVRCVTANCAPERADLAARPLAVWTTTCIFLAGVVGLDKVSRVSPDLLVTAGFLLGCAQTLRLAAGAGVGMAAVLGLMLGAGVWLKGAFVPNAVGFLASVLAAGLFAERSALRAFWVAGATFGLCFASYVAAVSWSYGGLTFGVTGPLNYAFHVDHLPHWSNWQGGPPPLGAPIHPTRQMFPDLPVFEFATPFRSTYPPFDDMAYWYQGFRTDHNPRLELYAIARNLILIGRMLPVHPFLPCTALALLIPLVHRPWRRVFRTRLGALWPVLPPIALGAAGYVMVHAEDRYLGHFVMVAALLPLTLLLDRGLGSRRLLAGILAVLFTMGVVGELVPNRAAVAAALRGADFHNDPEWRLAAAVAAHGLRPDDPVAVVHDTPSTQFTWAYVAHLRVVAEFGPLPYRLTPWDRTRFDPPGPDPGEQNYAAWFWRRLTAERRAQVIGALRAAGARAVIAYTKPADVDDPGWRRLPGTGAWIYDLTP